MLTSFPIFPTSGKSIPGSCKTVQRHIITCEFPPQVGGVSDYTYSVAKELAARGDEVHVWCPESNKSYADLVGVTVHGDLDAFSPTDLRRLDRSINHFNSPRKILVQWVPHGYKCKSLNLLFCLWVLKRASINHDSVELMVHEPFLSFQDGNWKQFLAAFVHRFMIICLLAAASQVWLSIPAWGPMLKPYCLGRTIPFRWLPIPSSVSVFRDSSQVSAICRRYAADGQVLLGHFGTYGRAVTDLLNKIIPAILEAPGDHSMILMGKGSLDFRNAFIACNPAFGDRLSATGTLDEHDLSCHIQACELIVQPYPDGISTRRTSAMASLAHERAIVTTSGHLTEPFWEASAALAIEPLTNLPAYVQRVIELLGDHRERRRLGDAAGILYATRFDVCHTIAALQTSRQIHL